jgi:hypothetical protein
LQRFGKIVRFDSMIQMEAKSSRIDSPQVKVTEVSQHTFRQPNIERRDVPR